LSLNSYSETFSCEEEDCDGVDFELGADAEELRGEVAKKDLVDDECEAAGAELLGYEEGGSDC
jgi:hypothetical protein